MCICDMICVYLGSFKCVNVFLFTQTKSDHKAKITCLPGRSRYISLLLFAKVFVPHFFLEFDAFIWSNYSDLTRPHPKR